MTELWHQQLREVREAREWEDIRWAAHADVREGYIHKSSIRSHPSEASLSPHAGVDACVERLREEGATYLAPLRDPSLEAPIDAGLGIRSVLVTSDLLFLYYRHSKSPSAWSWSIF
jgi:hypothetical protein